MYCHNFYYKIFNFVKTGFFDVPLSQYCHRQVSSQESQTRVFIRVRQRLLYGFPSASRLDNQEKQ